MTKDQLVDKLAEGTGLMKLEVAAVIDGFIAVVSSALRQGESVTLRGFGTFLPVERKARKARNPVTKNLVYIPARRAPYFRPAQELRKAVADAPGSGAGGRTFED
ncbi:MAG: HU family DNA-binding protein [candidate division KSB1 bacterium]|nr:HU family DNA-binding protein [candidate division KSB1 bacterium]MDZ7385083.1 HU family DNA-binding protein [candidate division KSB1 bacterium]MDZ7391658.1 HU family DNA-binding protein [candidate division KSB1 bacterium]MDZ7413408.1 HU family DNA-binding protein [candidate division KSB1 bacterium]